MKNRIFQNWKLKLISLGCAFLLWMTIYSVNDPQETKTMHNVPVTFVNTEAITDQGKTYEVLEKTDVMKSVKLSASRTVLNDIKDSDINVVADFSKYRNDGTVEVNIYSDRHNDDITFKASREDVLLKIEDKVERSFPVEVQYTGELKKSYVVGGCSLTPNRIMVSGGESYVDTVAKVTAEVDLSGASGDFFSYANIVLYDKDNNILAIDKLELGTKTVNAKVDVLATKTVPVRYVPTGTTTHGYVALSEVLTDYNEIAIAGKQSVLSNITEIVVSGEALTYENADANVELSIDIDDYLPEGVSRLDKSGAGVIDVTVQVSALMEKYYVLETGKIALENIPDGYKVEYVYDKAEITVMLLGAESILDTLEESELAGKIDIATWMTERNMDILEDETIYKITPTFTLEEGVEVVSVDSIEIIVNKLED